MRIPLLRTLSGRIVLGFAVLVITFGTVTAVTVGNLDLLNHEIRVIRTGYVKLALISKDLSENQRHLRTYLQSELEAETSWSRVETRLKRFQARRAGFLRDARRVLDDQRDLPDPHRKAMAATAARLAQLEHRVEEVEPYFEALLSSAPPQGLAAAESSRSLRPEALPEEVPEVLANAREALDALRRRESRIYNQTVELENQQRSFVERTGLRLEHGERKLRLYTVYLGGTAVLVGVLITAWAALSLRPLRRLREGAARIAGGDYGSRIEERGPREVAELAREFNAMGRAVEERERDLVRSERLAAVGQMAAMITHEIRNPLSSIGLNTELLEEEIAGTGESPSEAAQLCRAITTEVDRLTAITEEYLHFARLPKPKLQPEPIAPTLVNLAAFEREVLALRGVKLDVDLGQGVNDAGLLVMADDAQLRQALLNLVRNAADALGEIGGGQIWLRSRYRKGARAVEILVEDDGPGIAEELHAKLFEPFFSTKEGGTGLGLAMTHQIIREHGGEIAVDSRPGHGTTFIVTLPAI
jgi:two-component system, NtrC family, sensor kinase